MNVNVWNTEPTVPSTEKNNAISTVEVELDNMSYYFNVYDTPLGSRFLEALDDNLINKRILEKNFCFLGFADTKRDLTHLCKELNESVEILYHQLYNHYLNLNHAMDG